ncbi:hypothetical protein [Haloferax marisrubri]|uniref:Uncharacterized protein n=1 Tax=Haloferax marisrubri TaxID=1544719 RepID=A0A2P4NKQ8_9EURY|nr:hypothetical protein [Haloferax marisrubri]POG53723.1 hypothetical protein AUR65_018255 [Haloferax marisrubri]
MNISNYVRNAVPWSGTDESNDDAVITDGAGGGAVEANAAANRPTGDSDDHDENRVGVFFPPNTLADVVRREWFARAEEMLGTSIPTRFVQDVRLGRNPLRIEDVTPMLAPEVERELLRLSYDADHALVPSSLGTGFPAYKFVDVGLVFEETVDVVVPSHKTADGLHKNPQNALLAGLGVAVMDAPAILIDHRAQAVGMDDVPPELAKFLAATTHTDVANRSFGYWSAAMTTVPIGGRAEMDLNPAVQRAANSLTPWLSAEQWAPWAIENGDIEPDATVPTLAEPDLMVVLPHGVSLGQHHNLRTIHADVANAHVVGFWPLDAAWIHTHVRRAGAAYIDAEIHDESSPLRQVWESHTAKFGVSDPVDRWERFYAEHVEPALPEQ